MRDGNPRPALRHRVLVCHVPRVHRLSHRGSTHMRGLIIGLPLSALLWWAFAEYGFHAIAFLMIALALLYIATTISRDWAQIKGDEWQDGEPVNYGKSDAPR